MNAPSADPDDNELLNGALRLAALGYPVFPLHHPLSFGPDALCSCHDAECEHIGKHPRTLHGFKDASNDSTVIRQWWAKWPNANIGMVTGSSSGIVVVDVDPRNGGDDSWAELLITHGSVPHTVQTITGNGTHFYFAHPGWRVKSKELVSGVDIKGDGGYVVVEPSLHESGRRYQFELSSRPGEVAVAKLPTWLATLLNTHSHGPSSPSATPVNNDSVQIIQGRRNTTLTSLAGTMRHRGMTPKAIEAALKAENAERCRPPLEDPEVETIAQSVCRYDPGEHEVKAKPWIEPQPLYSSAKAIPFPIRDVFPESLADIREYLVGLSTEIQVPIALPAMLLLPIAATAIAGKFQVEAREGWRENPALWSLIMMESGERKSVALRRMMDPLHEWERDEAERLAPEIAAEVEALESLEEERKIARKKGSQGDAEAKDRAREIAIEIAGKRLKVPPTLVTSDATSEALVSMMVNNSERALVASAEADALDVMLGRYDDKKQPNMGIWLNGYSGDRVRVHRKSHKSEFLESPILCVAIVVQPEAVRGLFANSAAKGRGLLARMFTSVPEPMVGYREIGAPAVAEHLHMAYVNSIRRLLSLPLESDVGPRIIRLSPEARHLHLELEHYVERELRRGGVLSESREWGAKLCGAILRVGLVLHCLENFGRGKSTSTADPAEISGTTMKAALAWVPYLIDHEHRASGLAGCDLITTQADKILAWLARTGEQCFSRRDCFDQCRGVLLRIVEDVDEPLQLLAETGYVRPQALIKSGPQGGKPPSPRFEVNPHWKRHGP